MKTCFKCQAVKPMSEFYAHRRMTDGHLGKCKECTKLDVTRRYRLNPDKIVAYERVRSQTPARKAMTLIYSKRRRELFPEKAKARNAVNNAVRDGRLKKQPCVHCGASKVQGHHRDYRKPLDVVWVCFKCHREIEHGQQTHG